MNPLLGGGLLAASIILGQTPEPPPKIILQGPPTVQPSQPTQRPILNFFTREDRPILNKIDSWFERDPNPGTSVPGFTNDKVIRQTVQPPMIIPSTPTRTTPASSDFPRKMPNPSSKATTTPYPVAPGSQAELGNQSQGAKAVELTIMKQDGGAVANVAKTPILAYLSDRIGRDEKFEWITGQFEIENGTHVLYYATPETVDKFHGRIVLQPQKVDMTQFHRGESRFGSRSACADQDFARHGPRLPGHHGESHRPAKRSARPYSPSRFGRRRSRMTTAAPNTPQPQ